MSGKKFEKIDQIISILQEISYGTHVNDVEDAFRRLLAPTFEDVRKLLENLKDSRKVTTIVEKYVNEVLKIWEKYRTVKVTYSPEMSFVVPYAWGSRRPLIQWKVDISERKMRMLRYLLQECGMCICAGFRGLRRIILVDVDPDPRLRTEEKLDIVARVLDHATELGLPCKVTWHLGVHVYIPADVNTYPLGLVIVHEYDPDRREYFLNQSPISLVDEHANVKVEVRVDYVTHHPLQSWLFMNIDRKDLPDNVDNLNLDTILKIVENIKVVRCGIPDTGPSLNWFKYGKSIRKSDAVEIFNDLVSRLVRDLKLSASVRGRTRVEKVHIPKIVEATSDILEKAVETPRGYENFQVSSVKGRELYITSPFHEGLEKLFILRERTLSEVVNILHELDRYGIAPRCVMKFLVEGMSRSEGKFVHSILAWYLLQHMFPIDENLLMEIAVESARVRKLTVPRLYYYEYFGTRVAVPDCGLYFARPRTVPLLKQALEEACASGTVCGECPFYNICCNEHDRSASARLVDVINLIAFDIVYGRASSSQLLRRYLNPRVVQRLVLRRALPLSRPRY